MTSTFGRYFLKFSVVNWPSQIVMEGVQLVIGLIVQFKAWCDRNI